MAKRKVFNAGIDVVAAVLAVVIYLLRKAPVVIAFRGATAWECQIGRFCVRVPYPRFRKLPMVYLAPKDGS